MASAYLSHVGDLSPILGFFGWWIIPGYVSSILLGIFYRVFPSLRPISPPPPSTDAQQKPVFNPIHEIQKSECDRRLRHHRSITHALVICVYLGYTLISAYREQAGKNYYSILGIQSNSLAFNSSSLSVPANLHSVKHYVTQGNLLDEAGLKSHWRKIARAHHPDKLNPPPGLRSESEVNLWKSSVESKFIEMREAYEALSDNAKQWAYDRFGPGISQWKNCITRREYLIEGIKQSAPFYGFSASSLMLIGSIRKSDVGTFWRWTILLLIIALEWIILTATSLTGVSLIMSLIFPNRAPFEHIELLRKIFIAGSCVATQLSGIIYPAPDPKKKQSIDAQIEPIVGLVEQIQEYSSVANIEVIKLMFNDLHPLIRDSVKNDSSEKTEEKRDSLTDAAASLKVQAVVSQVKEKMLDTFCDLKLQSDPDGQAAWIKAVRDGDATH